MPFAIIRKDGSEGIAVGLTQDEAWENANLKPEERAAWNAIEVSEQTYQELLADPTPEEQLGD